MRRSAVVLCVLALAGCASNAEVAAQRCAGQSGDAYSQCVNREQAKLAAARQPPASNQGGY
jgi:hypothetical protein